MASLHHGIKDLGILYSLLNLLQKWWLGLQSFEQYLSRFLFSLRFSAKRLLETIQQRETILACGVCTWCGCKYTFQSSLLSFCSSYCIHLLLSYLLSLPLDSVESPHSHYSDFSSKMGNVPISFPNARQVFMSGLIFLILSLLTSLCPVPRHREMDSSIRV